MRAMVIRTFGDPELAGAIADGIQRVVVYDENELAQMREEVKRLRDKNGLRAYGDGKRYETARRELARKYRPERHSEVYWLILRAWAALWYGAITLAEYLAGERK